MTPFHRFILVLYCVFAPPIGYAQTNINDTTAKILAAKYLCLSCHKVEDKLICPAYRDIADRYQGTTEAQTKLIAKIRKGGQGVWGSIPMPPFNVPDRDINIIVTWILGNASVTSKDK